jgi:hypothetical protein
MESQKAAEEEQLEHAKKVVVSLVSSPLYPKESQVKLDDELKEYFSKERTLARNDYFRLKSFHDSS